MKLRHAVICLLLAGCAWHANAQSEPSAPIGVQPYGSYDLDSIGSVDLLGGNLFVSIPIFNLKQRGALQLPLRFLYNSQQFNEIFFEGYEGSAEDGSDDLTPDVWYSAAQSDYGSNAAPFLGPTSDVDGLRSPNPFLGHWFTTSYIDGYTDNSQDSHPQVIVDETGANHVVGLVSSSQQGNSAVYKWRTLDATGLLLSSTFTSLNEPYNPNEASETASSVTTPDGVTYHTIYTETPDPNGTSSDVNVTNNASDANGNTITANQLITSLGLSAWQITDTVGRTYQNTDYHHSVSTATCSNSNSIAYADSENYAGYGTLTLCYAAVHIQTNFPETAFDSSFLGESGAGNFEQYVADNNLLVQLILPDGTSWRFEYLDRDPNDSAAINYGTLTKITTPAGGSISYKYASMLTPNQQGYQRVVISRTTDAGDGGPSQTWTYSRFDDGTFYVLPNLSSPNAHATVDVTDPAGNRTSHIFTNICTSCTYFTSNPPGAALPWLTAVRETQTELYDGTSSLLESVSKSFTYDTRNQNGYTAYVYNVMPYKTTTTLDDGSASTSTQDVRSLQFQAYLVGDPRNLPSLPQITGLYGISLSDSISDGANNSTSYRMNSYSYMFQSSQSFLDKNLLSAKYDSSILFGNMLVGYTFWGYDENNGSPQGTYGNQTSVHRWLNTENIYVSDQTVYDSHGMPISYIDPDLHQTNLSYDSAGVFAASVTSPSTTSAAIGIVGSNPSVAHVDWAQYDDLTGELQATVPENGSGISDNAHKTEYFYDSAGRVLNVTGPESANLTFAYGGTDGQRTVTTTLSASPDPNRITVTTYDGFGRPVRTQVANGNGAAISPPWDTTDICYDYQGRQSYVSYVYQSDGTGARVCPGWSGTVRPGDTKSYDALGRETRLQHSDGTYSYWQYRGRDTQSVSEGHQDLSGNTVLRETVTHADLLGRITTVCEVSSTSLSGQFPSACGSSGFPDETGYLTTYEYDGLGNVHTVHQQGLADRVFTFDSLSRLTDTSNPESGQVHYDYDHDGLVVDRIAPGLNFPASESPDPVTTYYTYDQIHRLILTSYDDGVTLSQAQVYDAYPGLTDVNAVGQRTALITMDPSTDSDNETVIAAHDNAGRPITTYSCAFLTCQDSVWGNYDFSSGSYVQQQMTYNASGDVIHLDAGQGISLDKHYNSVGKLASITGHGFAAQPVSFFSNAVYAPGGLVSAALGNGLQITNQYDVRNRVISLSLNPLGGGQAYTATPTYAADGIIQTAFDSSSGGFWAYGYDEFDRLQTAQNGSAIVSWTYDRFGNRLSQTASGTSTFSLIQTSLTAPNGDNRFPDYCYDPAGNLLALASCSSGYGSLQYDAEHRINYAGAFYMYDAAGRRTVTGVGSYTYYDVDGNAIWQQTASGWRFNIFNGTQMLATYHAEDGSLFYSAADWLGTTRHLTDSTGTAAGDCFSLPFGDSMTCSNNGQTVTDIHFTGKERDQESGLDYFGARYYGASIGRFMSPDPSGLYLAGPTNPQSLNLYSYVLNNPLVSIDPDGLECVWSDGSYDSNDDKDTGDKAGTNGDHSGCRGQGGAWVDHSYFQSQGLGDWSAKGNTDLAGIYTAITSNSTTVNVNADGSGSSMTDNYGYDPSWGVYNVTQDTSNDPDPVTQLASQITADSNHYIGCIAAAEGVGSGGTAAYQSGQPINPKPFAGEGVMAASSPASEFLSGAVNKLKKFPKGSYPSPVGGPGTGMPFRIRRTPNAGRAAGRWLPILGLAADAYAATQLWNCLGH